MSTQWQDQRLQDALHNVANDHDVERAVKALLAEAWEEGRMASQGDHERYPARAEDNPYSEREA